MELFLHIQIANKRINFVNDTFLQLKSIAPEVSFFDVDNYSDNMTISTAIRALQEAQKVLVYIEVESDADPGGVLKLIKGFMNIDVPLRIIYSGNHTLLDNMMVTLKRKACNITTGPLKAALQEFF